MMDANAERDGLTRAILQTEVESRLRQAGIKVGPNPTGHLLVDGDTIKGENGKTYVYNVENNYGDQFIKAYFEQNPKP